MSSYLKFSIPLFVCHLETSQVEALNVGTGAGGPSCLTLELMLSYILVLVLIMGYDI